MFLADIIASVKHAERKAPQYKPVKGVVQTIEEFIDEKPQANYMSIADFIAEVVHLRFEQLGIYSGSTSFLDFDAKERFLRNLRKIVQILINPQGLDCMECEMSNCRHIRFALTNPKTQKLIFKTRNGS